MVAAKDLSDREKFHSLDWRNDSVSWSLRRELGLHLFLNPDREFRNDELDLLELQRQTQRHALIIKDFLGITIRRNASPIQILQQLLEQIGLRLVCDRREGARGDQVRVYRLDLEQWAIAQEVLEYRRSKRESQAQREVEAASTVVVTGVYFDKNINKGGAVTTEGELLSEELADGLDILTQAVAVQEWSLVRSLWMTWDLSQRSAVLMQMSDELRSQVIETLGLLPGAIVRWMGKAGDWIVEAVEGLQVKVRQESGLGQDWRVVFAELDPIELG